MSTPASVTLYGVVCPVLEREVEWGVVDQSAKKPREVGGGYALVTRPNGDIVLVYDWYGHAPAVVSVCDPHRARHEREMGGRNG